MEQNQTMTPHSKYHSWSLLDPTPVCFFDKVSNVNLAVWNGIYMTRNQAMMIACEKYMNIWATPTMKDRAWKEFSLAYHLGAFGHRNWDNILERITSGSAHYSMLSGLLSKHLISMRDYQGPEVLSWFNLHKENNNE